MNLPNGLTLGRIVITPLITLLPFSDSWTLRLVAFVLFLVAGVSDYADGVLARSRKQETDFGRLLDPLADKLLLIGTLVPMFLLVGSGGSLSVVSPHDQPLADHVLGPMSGSRPGHAAFPFLTPLGPVGLPWWILVVVLGREVFMTVFRQAAARRGVVIAAIGPAKWKTAFQLVWQGSAYFWFWIATLAALQRWDTPLWHAFAYFNGIVGTLMMTAAVALTIYSLWLYMRRYGYVFWGQRVGAGR